MQIKAIKTRIFRENEGLLPFILKYVKKVPENSVLVITSKIVALAEGRTAEFKNKKQKIALIKSESDFATKTKLVWLTVKDNTVMADAGIDESNGFGKLVLLPKDSFQTAKIIREKLKKHFKIKNLGILISDSGFLPLRSGVIGIALGYAGFRGVKNYQGKKDIFGRKLIYSRIDIADSLATSAILSMGEGNEIQPLAVITSAPIIFTDRVKKKELIIDPKKDIYAPLFNKLN